MLGLIIFLQWMAPEAILRKQYSEASDAFSFGVLLWYFSLLLYETIDIII